MSAQVKAAYVSHFFHTRGEALMQMDRMVEAAGSFEMAIQERPKNEAILAQLEICYRGRDEKQADVYKRRLEQVQAENRAAENADN